MTRVTGLDSFMAQRGNKYHAVKTYSHLCGRAFDSKGEAKYAEELRVRELAGDILNLQYQIPFVLSKNPKVIMTVDFVYQHLGELVYEDFKGMGETREFRVKRIWLEQSQGIHVNLIRRITK